jgi:hypothetical protein
VSEIAQRAVRAVESGEFAVVAESTRCTVESLDVVAHEGHCGAERPRIGDGHRDGGAQGSESAGGRFDTHVAPDVATGVPVDAVGAPSDDPEVEDVASDPVPDAVEEPVEGVEDEPTSAVVALAAEAIPESAALSIARAAVAATLDAPIVAVSLRTRRRARSRRATDAAAAGDS